MFFFKSYKSFVINFYLTTYLCLVLFARKSLQYSNLLRNNQIKTPYLPETKFNYNEYSEYPDNDEGDKGPQAPQAPQWSQLPSREISQIQSTSPPVSIGGDTQSSITWDEKWPSADIKFGQLSAVSIDPIGNVAVFHRGSRVWGTGTFDDNDRFDREEGPIRENTIILINGAGEKIAEWGGSLFYLPHGLTIDHLGNYWITDVAMHQVFKFNAEDVEREINNSKNLDSNSRKKNLRMIKPALTLGDPFEPGNDKIRFCKPTAVAVQKNGDFFVSDGYCNSRIIKFNKNGERILTWGRKWVMQENLGGQPRPTNAFYVPHSLALAEELEYLFVADRENGRILCFHSSNGTFHKEYQHPAMGSRIFSVSYAKDNKIYAVNGPEFSFNSVHVRGFVLDINSGNLISQFAPGRDMHNPHDVVVSQDGKFIYVVELDPHQIHKFLLETNSTQHQQKIPEKVAESVSVTHPPAKPLFAEGASSLTDGSRTDSAIKIGERKNSSGTTVTTIILSLVTAAVVLVVLCVAVAAIVARCRKRGCLLLTARHGMRWESSADRRENFKLSNLLETRKMKVGRKFFDKRPNTRDFSKLNTEPETSDDENNLTKMI